MKPIFFIAIFVFAVVPSLSQFTYAKLITISENQSDSNQWICFRKIFPVNEIPKSGVGANIAVDSMYWLRDKRPLPDRHGDRSERTMQDVFLYA